MLCDFGCGTPAIKVFKSGRACCSIATSSCLAMKVKNSEGKLINLNWPELQLDYDAGLSIPDLVGKYGVTRGGIQSGVKRGFLVIRSGSEALKKLNARGGGAKAFSSEVRLRIAAAARANILARYAAGWMPKAGRSKKFEHVSPSAGTVQLDGTWELGVAVWLDTNNINWRRNTTRFPYMNLKGTLSYYTPDFWVESLGGYLEVKGYETELGRCKWRQFSAPLTVWKRQELVDRAILMP